MVIETSPLVAIVTVNYNHADDTIKCLESILQTIYTNYQIFVVDNGSNDIDYQKLNLFVENANSLKLVRLHKNKGYVGGINFGLSNASQIMPDYYLIMNNDTLMDKDAVKELITTSEKYNKNCIVSGKVYNMDEPDTLQYIGQWCKSYNNFDFPPYIKGMGEKDLGQYDQELEMDMLDDIFWLLPDNVFKRVGYYCDYFFLYGEQNDYVLRAKKLGFKMIYTPNAKIWHYHHLSLGDDNNKAHRINYWTSYAVLLLVYLHLSYWHFIKFYVINLLKLFAKSIIRFGTVKQKTHYQPMLYAYFYFTKWLLNKKPNNGFNPY